MPRLLALVVLLILYGSLYPWRFEPAHGGIGPVLRTLIVGRGDLYFRDALVNVVFYMPVGACAFLAFRPRWQPVGAASAAVVLGAALSLSVEIAQAYAGSRLTSIYDVYANTAGSIAGAAVAAAFSSTSRLLHRREGTEKSDPRALALIVCWLAFLLFPFVPLLSMYAFKAKIVHAWIISPLPFFSTVVAWFVIGNALQASGVRGARLICGVSVLLLPAQLLILGRYPTLADFAGAIAGAALFAYASKRDPGQNAAHKAGAVAIIALLFARGWMPLQFTLQPKLFHWIPFESLLEIDWQRASLVLSEKLFFYGAAIWSVCTAGNKLRTAAFVTAAVLLVIEGMQVWLRLHTPETTDPLLALMIGVGFDAFHSGAKRTSSPSGTSV